jgi:hypothetical protein
MDSLVEVQEFVENMEKKMDEFPLDQILRFWLACTIKLKWGYGS